MGEDFVFVPCKGTEATAETVKKLYLEEVRKYGLEQVQILTSYRVKTAAGVVELNRALEDLINPPMVGKKEQADGLLVYYTEWNENAIFGAYTNDTRKVAAYNVRAALDVETFVAGSSIWCFSDIFEEMHQFPQEFHGGFGIMTLNGIPKPVFYAMKMLAQVGDERIDLGADATTGEIGIGAFRSKDEIQVLLFRQKMKNLDFPKEKACIRIELEKAPQTVTVQRIDEEHGNPLKMWEEQGCPADLNHREVQELIEKSIVKEETVEYQYENQMLLMEAELGVNDVYLIRIKQGNK